MAINLIKIAKEKLQTQVDDLMNPNFTDFQKDYIKRKAVEECNELATALMQSINKHRAQNDQQIEDEIADTLMWITELSKYYNTDYINARVEKKKQTYFKNDKLCSDCI